jgi:2-(1,2-epoxy-1,2-dihydrophenyl)acetyl-CoA isomerase
VKIAGSHSIISSVTDKITYNDHSMTSSILFEIRDHIAFITLNRPEKLNAFNREMALLLQNRLDECAGLHEVRAVYITGAGKAFSAGQDLAEVVDVNGPGMDKILSEHYNPIVTRIRNLPKPVVAAVGGVAAGAGANIALCCDIVVAAQSASFIQAFSRIGLIPDSGGTYFLPRLVGWQKAAGIAMLGDKIGAAEAERMGMIYKVYENDDFADASRALAATLAQLPTRALALTKHAFNHSGANSLEAQLRLEDELQQKAAGTRDFQEGVQAFLAKRPPVFKGE